MQTLIVDGQMWQTDAYFRGMGGYAFGLLGALARANPELDLHIVLNEHMTHDETRLTGIQQRLPQAKIHLLDLPFEPKPEVGEEERAVVELDRFVTGLGTAKADTYYFIPALFLFQYCAVFPTNVRKVLLFHDLMPLIYRDELGKYFPSHIYFPRFKTIFETDLIVTNSQTTADDLLAYLGVDERCVVNIDGSLNEHLVNVESASRQGKGVLDDLGLRDAPYILMPTGGLENKNNIRATEAFRLLCDAGDDKTRLVVTSFFDEAAKQELQLIAGDRITFTGNITNDDLLELYTQCSVVLMPSLYEGLGLPVLEGVAHGKPVACSDVSVFREIPHFKQALYAFNPFDVQDIASALASALAQQDFKSRQKYYQAILAKYDWSRSADIFGSALREESHFMSRQMTPHKRFAVFCPDPRKNNDVAVFAQRMYGYAQREGMELVYFIDPGGDDEIGAPLLPDYIRWLALCYDIDAAYSKLRDESFDGVIHFMKSDERFSKLLRASMSIPGYVYVADDGYANSIQLLQGKGMISQSQAQAESLIAERCRQQQAFEAVSVIAAAKGIIAERPRVKSVERALRAFGVDVPCVEAEPCAAVNNGEQVHAKQQRAYGELLAFIGGER